jgi:hypothetical protein
MFGQVFDFVNNQWIPFTLIFQNQRTITSDYFKPLKKPGSFLIYLEIVENSDYIWEIVSFV